MIRKTGNSVTIEAFAVDRAMQDIIRVSLREILEAHGCLELILPIFTCVNELLVNAVKANYKNLYFENYKPLNLSKGLLSFNKSLELFKYEIGSEGADQLKRLAINKNIKAVLSIRIHEGVLYITVTNPTPMTALERHNVGERLAVLKRIDQLSDFFNMNDDDEGAEGAGLGIVFVGMVLRSLGISSGNFLIESDAVSTIASFSTPLNETTICNYKTFVGK